MSYEHDHSLLDAAGNRRVSYGPRRIEVERVVDGKSYVSYRQHHPEHGDADAHVVPCDPADAAFWGVYQHDAEGLAAIVGDAHDEASAKAFAEHVARSLGLEAQRKASVTAAARVVLVMEGERIQNIVADAPVDITCVNYDDDEIDELKANGMNVVDVPQSGGGVERAVVDRMDVELDPKETERLVLLRPEVRPAPEPEGVREHRQLSRDALNSRALRIKQGIPRYIVDGHEFRDDESSCLSDGRYPPFVVFDVDLQENLPGEFGTRAVAEKVAALKNAEQPHRLILAINTNTAAFTDLGHACEVARVLRSVAGQLQLPAGSARIGAVDTNGNAVCWLYESDVVPDLESPGMVHLVVEAGEDLAFGTTEADCLALAEAFRRLSDQLDGVKDLAQCVAAFPVEVREAPYERSSRVTSVKVGRFHYTPAFEPDASLAPRAAGECEL